jgi:hypothetical protein
MHGQNKDVELQGQLNDNSPAPLSKRNVAVQAQWIQGRKKDYYILASDVASQLAWVVAAFKDPPGIWPVIL